MKANSIILLKQSEDYLEILKVWEENCTFTYLSWENSKNDRNQIEKVWIYKKEVKITWKT